MKPIIPSVIEKTVKPCPRCKTDAKAAVSGPMVFGEPTSFHRVNCTSCGKHGKTENTKASAIQSWNDSVDREHYYASGDEWLEVARARWEAGHELRSVDEPPTHLGFVDWSDNTFHNVPLIRIKEVNNTPDVLRTAYGRQQFFIHKGQVERCQKCKGKTGRERSACRRCKGTGVHRS